MKSRTDFLTEEGYNNYLRVEFAARAMHGLIANAPNGNLHNSTEGCQLAVQWADDLIKELNK